MKSLVIEVTRRCNQRCDHCMRGDAQDRDLQDWVIDEIAKVLNEPMVVSEISDITLTGGEPFLKPEIIMSLLSKCHDARFWVATNGTVSTPEALVAAGALLSRWYNDDVRNICERETGPISVSDDIFHEPPHVVWAMLGYLRGSKMDAGSVIPLGRAADNSFGWNHKSFGPDCSNITVTVDGLVVCGCDYAYDSVAVLGSVKDLKKFLMDDNVHEDEEVGVEEVCEA